MGVSCDMRAERKGKTVECCQKYVASGEILFICGRTAGRNLQVAGKTDGEFVICDAGCVTFMLFLKS
jgi:hypothetical protein